MKTVKRLAENKQLPQPSDVKIVREAVLGYQVLEPYEYLILDSPVMQRLRYIHQTALAYLVYPTATHTRFDHSLGVAKLAGDIAKQITSEDQQVREVRLAGLLHDVGTTFFSHLSEGMISQRFDPVFTQVKRLPTYEDRAPGEILSHLIITSESFKDFVRLILSYYNINLDLDRVAQLVVGKPSNSQQFAFMADIITGPFDADKLDYLVRDCYFTGIRSDVDVPRITISSAIADISRIRNLTSRNLVIQSSGVSNLEQAVFAKMLLYPAIYHHHTIRAIECMVKGIFETIFDDPDRISSPLLRFDSVTNFLRCSEHDFFSFGQREATLNPLILKLIRRELMKRCLVVAPRYVRADPHSRMHDFSKLGEHPDINGAQIKAIRRNIRELVPAPERPSLAELWIDLPKSPNINKDADRCWVDPGTDSAMLLSEFFPYPRWADSYEANKWKGHVFSSPQPEQRKAVNRAAVAYFKDTYGIDFDRQATEECKL